MLCPWRIDPAACLVLRTRQPFNGPNKLINTLQGDFPDHLQDVMMDYGLPRDAYLTIHSVRDYQNAMMVSTRDCDLYTLGLKLTELILRNEFSIAEGGFNRLTHAQANCNC